MSLNSGILGGSSNLCPFIFALLILERENDFLERENLYRLILVRYLADAYPSASWWFPKPSSFIHESLVSLSRERVAPILEREYTYPLF